MNMNRYSLLHSTADQGQSEDNYVPISGSQFLTAKVKVTAS